MCGWWSESETVTEYLSEIVLLEVLADGERGPHHVGAERFYKVKAKAGLVVPPFMKEPHGRLKTRAVTG
jgi:hypothetical protein